MSVLLYLVGALLVIGGATSILFGVPIKEFSFGDTLIMAGTVAFTGGVIVVGLAAAVSQLQRIAELLNMRPAGRSGRPLDLAEGGRAGSRVPFPPKPKTEPPRPPVDELPPFVPLPVEELPPPPSAPPVVEPEPVAVAVTEVVVEELPEEPVVPVLRNPEIPLPPEEPVAEPEPPPAPPPFRFPDLPRPPAAEPPPPPPFPPRTEPSDMPPWRRPSPLRSEPRPEQPSYFDAMWDNEPPPAPPPPEPARSRPDVIARVPEPEPEPEPLPESLEQDQPAPEPPRAVAVLKSGVVDGMGYTLYVDGSIEAELPDGTLRFASINELRAHLERAG